MNLTPKQFLKSRRPRQFSDSIEISEDQLSRPVLEFYLETLSNKSQELEFEKFAKRLCEIEICPNLLPHTGPSGGGDSKVDSETYPVSDSTALGWFVGIGNKAANERWGFAFSTKKDWVAKAKDDIKKIHETERGYKVAYFVSNRFIPDKKRAEVEDELRKKYDIDVRILDKNWILDKIFGKKLENVVRAELHIDVIEEKKTKKGPLDSQREEALVTLDKKIVASIAENNINSFVIDDAIESAILSRELEKDRIEIDGRFERAKRLAKECGSEYQLFEVAYQLAWTTFWWHEDHLTFISLYPEAAKISLYADNIYNLERQTNLWYLLNVVYNREKNLIEKNVFDDYTQALKKKLEEIVADNGKPSASLYAKSLLLQIELTEKRYSGENMGQTINDIKEVIIQSKNHIGFPFRSLIDILTEMGDILDLYSEYNELFEEIIKTVDERDGELASAKLLLRRGEKLLLLERPYEAIKALGLAIQKLYKDESKNDEVRALYITGLAYEQVGLYWAARGVLLSAASLVTSGFWAYGEINKMQAACYAQLKWLELKLGRITQALDWHKLDFTIRNMLVQKGFDKNQLFDQINMFDFALGIMFLRADIETLKTLELLPDTLAKLGLDYSEAGLIYALGCEDKLPKEFTQEISKEELNNFFAQWANQYSSEQFPSKIISDQEENIILSSKILGCQISVKVENQQPYLEVAESILSAAESFLSTALLRRAASREPELEIRVTASLEIKNMIEYKINDDEDRPIVLVKCKKFNPHKLSKDEQKEIGDNIFDIIANISGRIMILADPQKDLREMIRDERAHERASNFTGSFVTLGNVLGHQYKTKISELIEEGNARYELERHATLEFSGGKNEDSCADKPAAQKKGDNPFCKVKHSGIQMQSIIKESFWDKAKWQGAGYFVMPDGERPPIFSILFTDIEAGKKIFESWKKKIGDVDKDERIRVTILRGIDKNNPYHYKIGIGSNMDFAKKEQPTHFISMTRIHVMTPASLQNLDSFIGSYRKFGFYLFAPGGMDKDGVPELFVDLGIVKREVNIREAWEVGENDLDCVLVSPTDDPIIPPLVQKPPVKNLLEKKKQNK